MLGQSETFYRALARNLPHAAAFVVDADLRYLIADGKALRDAGMHPADLEGKTIYEALPTELARTYEPHYRAVLAGGTFELEHTSHGRRYLTCGTPIWDDQHHVRAALAVSYDLTNGPLKTAAESRSPVPSNEILKWSEYGLFTTDLTGQVSSWDSGMEQLLGFHATDVIGSRVEKLFTPEEFRTGTLRAQSQHALHRGASIREGWMLRKIERPIWVAGVLLPILDEFAEAVGLVWVVRDCTQRRLKAEPGNMAEGLLLQPQTTVPMSTATLLPLDLTKEHSFAAIVHELRTPLTPMVFATKMLLRRSDLPAPVIEGLRMIENNLAIESRLLDDLFNLFRSEHGRMVIEKTPLDLRSVLQKAVQTAHADFVSRRQEFRSSISLDHPLLFGDSGRLQQVFWNLLRNASKFTADDGVITLRTSTAGERVIIEITDNGIGFDPSLQNAIFQPFVQADGAVKAGGLGLGLSIAKSIVEAHGGTITGRSSGSGQGATFTVSLPYQGFL